MLNTKTPKPLMGTKKSVLQFSASVTQLTNQLTAGETRFLAHKYNDSGMGVKSSPGRDLGDFLLFLDGPDSAFE